MTRALKRATKKPNVQLTERDRSIFRALYEFRLVSNQQLKRLTQSESSDTAFNKRLKTLFDAGFIDRPNLQKNIYGYGEKRPTVNALGQRAGEEISKTDRVWIPKGKSWKTANELKSATYMSHRLGIVDTVLEFQEDLRRLDGARFIDRDELILTAPGETQKLKYPWRLKTRFILPSGKVQERSTNPDYTFAIGDARSGGEKRGLFFLEWDNKTEAFVRSDPDQSMILGLYLRYADIYRRELHTERYGFRNFRVPIVVNDSWDRVHKMISVFQAHAKHLVPAGVFIHTTMAELEDNGALAPIWLNGKGERLRILSD